MTLDREPHGHTPEAIATRLSRALRPSYLRDFVYGGIDGSVTTFAVVSGVWGAGLPTRTLIVLGIANLVADGFSMAAGNFMGTRSELEQVKRLRSIEERQLGRNPEGEREEIRQIFARKGIQEPTLTEVVKVITSDHDRWIETMLVEEYGLPPVLRSPLRSAAATFAAFVLCGALPLISFTLGLPEPFLIAAGLTGVTFFGIGSAKSRWSVETWWKSGLQTLAIGASASALAYYVGALLGR
jgi:vacuolar iron transporter family protein